MRSRARRFDADRSVSVVLEGFNVMGTREVSECRPGVPIRTCPVPEALVRGQPVDACTFVRYPAFVFPSIGVEAKFTKRDARSGRCGR